VVKLVIENWDSVKAKTIRDVERRVLQKEDKIIYVDSIEVLRTLLTRERLGMLSQVRKSRPLSLYSLAKLMKKDIKTISTDAGILSQAGLLKLETYKEGKKTKVRPRVTASKINLELAI
jgi:predicted transcriptional regulator